MIFNLIIAVNDDHGMQRRYTDPILAQCRRWTNIEPELGQCNVLTNQGQVELWEEIMPIYSSL